LNFKLSVVVYPNAPMSTLLQEIKSSLLHLISRSIEALPAVIVVLAILFLTGYAANLTRTRATVASLQMAKNQALQLLLVQISYVSVWVVSQKVKEMVG
jgi:hypothetical protein